MDAQTNLNKIKAELTSIKTHGGHISQYDSILFQLFVDSYKNNYMDLNSNPCLTADAILKSLKNDTHYQNCPNKTKYNLDDTFHQKWQFWTEAFQKGFSGNFIRWV